jgi:branched-subunit amino acid ABC-type transport system permease component
MESIVFGIVSGSIILLGAVGFSMTMNSDHFVNIAHGQMLLFGAYISLLLGRLIGSFLPAAVLGVLLTGALGVGLYEGFFRPVKTKGALVLLFTSVGIAWIIGGITGAVAGKKTQAYDIPSVQAISIGGRPLITIYEVLIVVFSVAAVVCLHLFLTRTRTGKMIRAVSDNHDLAQIRGINPRRVSNYVWLIASCLAGTAGVFSGVIGALDTELGWRQILIILAATVLGGLGSIYGVMVASILLGLCMEIGILIIPSYYRTAIAFATIIIILIIRPEGLQSLWRREASRKSG